MDYNKLLQKVRDYVLNWFDTHDNPDFTYHNLLHTKEVADMAGKMATHYKLNAQDSFIVQAAAWFHDSTYQQGPEGHEQRGADKAAAFLKDLDVEPSVIQAVQGCILATKLPQSPKDLLQQILCDADLYHLGTPEFGEKSKLLRKEEERRLRKKIDKKEWWNKTLMLLQSHHFFTDYSQHHFSEGVQEHIRKLINKTAAPEESRLPAPPIQEEHFSPEAASKEKEKHKKEKVLDKGMETLFRISSTNNLRLSDMADSKAHIMINVNSIIITILIATVLKSLNHYAYLTLPILLLLTVNLITVFFSMLATKPSLPRGDFSTSDLEEKKVNLMFFGNYYRMDFEAYSEAMDKVIDDKTFLYANLKRDIYQQGIVLSKKYRMLKVAYLVFMYGLIAAVASFIIAVQFH